MKKSIVSLLFFFFAFQTIMLSQDGEKKFYEKYRIGAGFSSLNYLDFPTNSTGLKVELGIPIYKRLTASLSFAQYESYFDYCDEIPVDVREQHFVYGLGYVFYEKKNWSLSAFAGLDVERVKYKELDNLPKDAKISHIERAHGHEGDHNYVETYTEGIFGVEANFTLSKHFQLNAATRVNTYSALTSSFSLFYLIDLNK